MSLSLGLSLTPCLHRDISPTLSLPWSISQDIYRTVSLQNVPPSSICHGLSLSLGLSLTPCLHRDISPKVSLLGYLNHSLPYKTSPCVSLPECIPLYIAVSTRIYTAWYTPQDIHRRISPRVSLPISPLPGVSLPRMYSRLYPLRGILLHTRVVSSQGSS